MKPQDLSNGESATNPYELALRPIVAHPPQAATLAKAGLRLQAEQDRLDNALWAISVGAELAGAFNDELHAGGDTRPSYVTSRTLGAVLALIESSALHVATQIGEIAGGDA